eukprot:scaffold891_cov130-Skeletonema_menzelii.AAC.2
MPANKANACNELARCTSDDPYENYVILLPTANFFICYHIQYSTTTSAPLDENDFHDEPLPRAPPRTRLASECAGANIPPREQISFELHPSVFIEDFLFADADDNADDSLYGEPDDISEEDVVEALSDGSHMNALVSYLLGEDLNSNIRVPEAA